LVNEIIYATLTVLKVLYFYISTFTIKCAGPNTAVFIIPGFRAFPYIAQVILKYSDKFPVDPFITWITGIIITIINLVYFLLKS